MPSFPSPFCSGRQVPIFFVTKEENKKGEDDLFPRSELLGHFDSFLSAKKLQICI